MHTRCVARGRELTRRGGSSYGQSGLHRSAGAEGPAARGLSGLEARLGLKARVHVALLELLQ